MPLLPCHLPPQPPSLATGAVLVGTVEAPRSRRRLQRRSVRRRAWHLVEWLIASFTYHELRCPKTVKELVGGVGAYGFSAQQRLYTQALFDQVIPFCRPRPPLVGGLGRGIDVTTSMLLVLEKQTLKSEYDQDAIEALCAGAEYVTADKVAGRLPAQAAQVDVGKCLSSDERRLAFETRTADLDPGRTSRRDMPKPCHMVSEQDEIKLVKRLLDAGIGILLP